MICTPCREGGKLSADANRVCDEESAMYLRARALERHGECEYPHTCGCQHHTGDWKNRRNDG